MTLVDRWVYANCQTPTTEIGVFTLYDGTTSWVGDPFTLLLSGAFGTVTRTLTYPTFSASRLIAGEVLINVNSSSLGLD